MNDFQETITPDFENFAIRTLSTGKISSIPGLDLYPYQEPIENIFKRDIKIQFYVMSSRTISDDF